MKSAYTVKLEVQSTTASSKQLTLHILADDRATAYDIALSHAKFIYGDNFVYAQGEVTQFYLLEQGDV
jgi:hypothetical protein